MLSARPAILTPTRAAEKLNPHIPASRLPISSHLTRHCFQLLAHLATGLYRAKGILWFREDRLQRYTFHLSGRQRVECVQVSERVQVLPVIDTAACLLVLLGVLVA